MGKGRGSCCSSSPEVPSEPEQFRPDSPSRSPVLPAGKLKIYIIYYSLFGHIATLAKKIKEGVDSVDGVEAHLFQVPETLTDDVLAKMVAPRKDPAVPIIQPEQMVEADGLIFGFPTRFGSMAAQMKQFFDSTGQLWKGQKLAGKPAGLFVSTGSQGGGQETTALTAITQLVHHGMLFVPIGYTFGKGMFALDEPRGGSPYGAGTLTENGSRQPSQLEMDLAVHQGRRTAQIVRRAVRRGTVLCFRRQQPLTDTTECVMLPEIPKYEVPSGVANRFWFPGDTMVRFTGRHFPEDPRLAPVNSGTFLVRYPPLLATLRAKSRLETMRRRQLTSPKTRHISR